MKNTKVLRLLSKISIVFAIVVSLTKLFFTPEYKLLVSGAGIPKVNYLVMLVNVLFNVFLFVGASYIFSALADIIESLNKINK